MLTDAGVADAERARVDQALHGPTVAGLLRRSPRAVHVLDAKYRPGDRCTVLYEVDGRLLTGRLDLAGEGPGAGLRLVAFPDDPALPALATVLDGAAMARHLTDALGERVRRCRPRLVRYRPDKRATVRLDLVGGGHPGLFAKAYHDPAKARRVSEVMGALHAALDGTALAVAAPIAHLPDLAVVVQAPLAGVPLGAADGGAAGRGLAALHAAAVPVDRSRPGASLLDKVEGRGRRVTAVAPATGEALLAVADRLRATARGAGVGEQGAVVVHGDCKPGQFLVGAGGIGLLDFDHVGTGDAALDVGAFLATAPLDGPVGREVLAGYGAGAELVPAVAWYRALALLTKAERAFARSWRSPRPVALLADADRSLDEAGLR